MKITTVLELLLILIIISFAAQAKPIDKAHKHGRKALARQSETAAVAPAAAPAEPAAPAAAAAPDDDEEFDIFDIFDDDEDDDADDDDDDDDDSDEEADDAADDDDDDDSDEETPDTDADEDDAIDLFSDLLDDDEETTPKPKPPTAAPVVASEPEAPLPEISVVPLNEKPPKRGELDTVEEAVDEEEEEEEYEASRKPTPKPTKNNLNKQQASQLLPLLTIQNTPALLELQAQLIGNTKKQPIEKPKKKKKTKGSVKKQSAILSNEIGDGDMRETVELTESPLYEIKVKKTENKPEVSVEGPIMEKVKLVKPGLQKKVKPAKVPVMTKQESEELYDDEESTTLSS